MADQKHCSRLAQGPLLVSLVTLPWVVNLMSPDKPDTVFHPQNLAVSLQGRGSSEAVSPKSLERTDIISVQGCLEPSLNPSWVSKGYAIRHPIC